MTERLTKAEAEVFRAVDVYERIHGLAVPYRDNPSPELQAADDATADLARALAVFRHERMVARR